MDQDATSCNLSISYRVAAPKGGGGGSSILEGAYTRCRKYYTVISVYYETGKLTHDKFVEFTP